MAEAIWREASDQGNAGMTAVGWVIWNRHVKWGRSVTDVILGKNQFTSMHMANPRKHNDDDPDWLAAQHIAYSIANGSMSDPTGGACYYYNPAIADSEWFTKNIVEDTVNHALTAKIGAHEFFA